MDKLQNCVLDVVTFNAVIGSLDAPTIDNLRTQAMLVLEEAKELVEALDESPEHLIKEMADVLVVTHGMLAIMNKMGYDVYGAWDKTNQNNNTKIIDSYTDMCYTKLGYDATETPVTPVQVGASRWVVKDENGKVRKPIGFISLKAEDMKEFTP